MNTPINPSRVAAILRTPAPSTFDRMRNLGPSARKRTSPEAVRDIRRRVEDGEKLDSVAASHGITMAAACMIANRQRRGEVV